MKGWTAAAVGVATKRFSEDAGEVIRSTAHWGGRWGDPSLSTCPIQ
ncbi:MAG: hypothetical protein ACYC6T_14285 [Thermoleophilia bacterium]